MEIEFRTELPSVEAYNQLRESAGMGQKNPQRVEIALKNSLYVITAYAKNRLIGHARVVGDGAVCYMVNDVMVARDYQGQGIGKQLMTYIDAWLEANTAEDSYVELVAVAPAHHLYAQFKFEASAQRVGMRRKQE